MTRTLVLVPAALILAGCGTAQTSSEGSGPTKNDASTSRVEFTSAGSDLPGAASLIAVGVVDYANEEGDLVLKSNGDAPGEMHAVFIGRHTYLGAEVDGKMRWESESTSERPTGPERFLPGPGGPRPDVVLATLRAASTKVEAVGEEKVRDVQTTHYKAHLKPVGAEDGASLRSEQAVVEAWIDGNGIARRMRVSYPPTRARDETVELYDFGVRPDIEAPPEDQVVSPAEFEKLMNETCRQTDAREKAPVWCLFFGGSVVESSGSKTYAPTERMPSKVTDGK